MQVDSAQAYAMHSCSTIHTLFHFSYFCLVVHPPVSSGLYLRQTFRAAPAERDRHELINLLFKFGELIFHRAWCQYRAMHSPQNLCTSSNSWGYRVVWNPVLLDSARITWSVSYIRGELPLMVLIKPFNRGPLTMRTSGTILICRRQPKKQRDPAWIWNWPLRYSVASIWYPYRKLKWTKISFPENGHHMSYLGVPAERETCPLSKNVHPP